MQHPDGGRWATRLLRAAGGQEPQDLLGELSLSALQLPGRDGQDPPVLARESGVASRVPLPESMTHVPAPAVDLDANPVVRPGDVEAGDEGPIDDEVVVALTPRMPCFRRKSPIIASSLLRVSPSSFVRSFTNLLRFRTPRLPADCSIDCSRIGMCRILSRRPESSADSRVGRSTSPARSKRVRYWSVTGTPLLCLLDPRSPT